MTWETRDGRGRYYTRSWKINGRRFREYVGTGLVAERAAAEDAQRRAERQARAEAARTERERWNVADAALLRFIGGAGLLTKASLLTAGFYQHDGGEWRKKQGEKRKPPTS